MDLGSTTCRIEIAGKYILRGVHAIEIKKSVHQAIQTATVELPLSVVTRNGELLQRIKLADKIKEGDTVSLAFGYNGKHRTEFTGYIRRIGDELPLVLECEDELYRFRKIFFTESFKGISLRKLVELITNKFTQATGIALAIYDKMPEMTFGKFMMKAASGVEVLNELKEKYGLSSYLTTIDGKLTLYVGLAYSLQKSLVKYSLARNTIGKGELKYTGAEDKKYRVKVENFRRDGKIKTVEVGEAGGDEKTIRVPGDLDEALLTNLAKKEIERLRTAGYKGSFETFLFPYAEPGTVALISDPQFAERGGRYYAGTVTTSFGVAGGRRKLEIDLKVSNNG